MEKTKKIGATDYYFRLRHELSKLRTGVWIDFERKGQTNEQRTSAYCCFITDSISLSFLPSIDIYPDCWRRRNGSPYFTADFGVSILFVHFAVDLQLFRHLKTTNAPGSC